MRKILLPLLILLAIMPSCVKKDKFDGFTRTVVYRQGDHNSKFYRIPAIITAKDGSLVIFTDKRKENETDLPEDIDVLCNYSTDGGLTWSEPYTIARGFGYMEGYGDCAVTYTNYKNGLIAIFVGGPGFWQSTPTNPDRTYKSVSYDNGRTWSEPEDITHFIFGSDCDDPVRSKWRACFCASGNGLITSKGRIMFVACIRETSAYSINNYLVYSDDNGDRLDLGMKVYVEYEPCCMIRDTIWYIITKLENHRDYTSETWFGNIIDNDTSFPASMGL